MALKTAKSPFTIVWDDGFVFIFSFTDDTGATVMCGFPHQVISVASQGGTQVQVSPTVAQIQQMQAQVAADPATWVDTVKTGARSPAQPVTVGYDDTISSPYTQQLVSGNPLAPTPGQTFTLQLMYSVTG